MLFIPSSVVELGSTVEEPNVVLSPDAPGELPGLVAPPAVVDSVDASH